MIPAFQLMWVSQCMICPALDRALHQANHQENLVVAATLLWQSENEEQVLFCKQPEWDGKLTDILNYCEDFEPEYRILSIY